MGPMLKQSAFVKAVSTNISKIQNTEVLFSKRSNSLSNLILEILNKDDRTAWNGHECRANSWFFCAITATGVSTSVIRGFRVNMRSVCLWV